MTTEDESKPTYSPYLSLPWIATYGVALLALWMVFFLKL